MGDPKYVKDFIDQMTPYAVAVGDQYGIDPITIITQAAVETGWGREVAGNNYFGVKSHGQPGGQNITTHEEVNGKRVKVRDNFRSYGSLGESVADYGRFLSENPRYTEALKETGAAELSGIANAGYATSSKYNNLTSDVSGMVKRNIRPLPPGSLPEVASLLDVVPPRAVAPVTPSIDIAQMRRTAPPSRLVADSFASLPQRSGAGLGDSLALNPVQADFPGAGQWDGGYSPSTGAVTLNANPRAIDLPRPRPQTAPSDLISTSMQRVASANPAKLPPVPPSTLGLSAVPPAPSRVTVSTPYTTPQSGIERGIARQSTIGQPPSTRVVQSVPMPVIQQEIPQSYAGMEGGYQNPDRLAPSHTLPPALYGGVSGVTLPPTPAPRLARAPAPAPPYRAVAGQLDVRPMPEMPRSRPNIGMGGVDIPGAISQTGQVATTPMPRLDRGGIFGKPQIAGHDIPLPGLFGVIQNATRAMANSSGPFNNGGDNLLYDTMRGGDFNTPGAATAQAGGYLYAPKPGGGFLNVGRSAPAMPGATLYDTLTRLSRSQDDAAGRVNGRGGSSGARSISG